MRRRSRVHAYAQPWPACWLRMQWDLALWASRWGADPRWRVQVAWSEGQLAASVDSEEFRAQTEPFMRELQGLLGERAGWEVRAAGEADAHEIRLQWIPPGKDANT